MIFQVSRTSLDNTSDANHEPRRGNVIDGVDEVIREMSLGEKTRITVPSKEGYRGDGLLGPDGTFL
jgi:FKBP-type peptidyl-prolyl cis-trans isomerase